MLYSMTGFSRVKKEFSWGAMIVEISSVNSRYLEISLRADRELACYEPMIQNMIRSRLARGKILVRAEIRWESSFKQMRINEDILRDYYKKMLSLQQELGGEVPSVTSLLQMQGVCDAFSAMDKNADELQSGLSAATDACIDGLLEMRAAEGDALKADLTENLAQYESILDTISARWKEISKDVFTAFSEKVRQNIEKLGFEADPARLAQELVIMNDKWDISEELTRSASHVQQFKLFLNSGGRIGRKMDFLVQEMNREINTMGSKSASCELRWLVVEGKTLLERLREQIQNVE